MKANIVIFKTVRYSFKGWFI